MRLLGTVGDETLARRFGDFLTSRRMPNAVEAGRDGRWQVWIERDDDQPAAANELAAFEASPDHPRYVAATATAARLVREESQQAERRRENFIDYRTAPARSAGRPTPVTIALIVLSIGVSFAVLFGGGEVRQRVIEAFEFAPLPIARDASGDLVLLSTSVFHSIARFQVWRLVTPIFLHFSLMHIVFNMLMLAQLGRVIEQRRSSLFLALFVLGSAIVSNSGQAIWQQLHHRDPTNPVEQFMTFGGMSGIDYALFGYLWINGRLRPWEGVRLSEQTVGLLLGWLVLCMTGLLGPIANAAHVCGLLAGCATAALPFWVRRWRRRA